MDRGRELTDRQLSEIVWMYYIDDMTQGDIAKKLSISRPTVISYLRQAKEKGLYEVRLQPEHFRLHTLASSIKKRFGLSDAYVVDQPELSGQALLNAVAKAAGYILSENIVPGDQLGTSWGETIWAVSQAMPLRSVENVVVRQLLGSLANPIIQSAEACTTEIARKLSAQCVNLNAPAICSKAELAQALRREPVIRQQLGQLKLCNKAILSLSPCDLSTHAFKLGISPKMDILRYASRGAVGIMLGRFFDANGKAVLGALDERLIGITLADLRSVKDITLVVCGEAKVSPTLAAMKGGYINRLVTDRKLGEALLSLAAA